MDPLRLRKHLMDNSNDLQEYCKDLKKWGSEMKQKEEKEKIVKEKTVKFEEKTDEVSEKPKKQKNKSELCSSKKTESINKAKVPKDYNYWDKFDVDAACEKIDNAESDTESDLTDEMEDDSLAIEEKEKGNKFVKSGRYEDAIKCYTNAIELYRYDPVYYANRALCHLKLTQYKSAEADCTMALQLDKTYVKALHRRALAREALLQYKEAADDLKALLEIEPHNKESRNLLNKISKHLTPDECKIDTQRPVSKFTLSRQKQQKSENTKVDEAPVKSKPVEPIKENVYERKRPEDEPKPSTSKGVRICEPEPQEVKKVVNKKVNFVWPSGEDVESISPIDKSPKDRSKARLKRVQVFDVDLKSEQELKDKMNTKVIRKVEERKLEKEQGPSEIKTDQQIINEHIAKLEEVNDGTEMKALVLDCNVDVSGENNKQFVELNLKIPSTSVQFYQAWKTLKDDTQRFIYLREINPSMYQTIFKDALETKIFSEMITALASSFIEQDVSVFEYLSGLSKVKRFSTLVMFKTSNDKQGLKKLFDYMDTKGTRTEEELVYLKKLYEM